MVGECLRIRGTTWWFRRCVPKSLTGRLGVRELTRTLRTACPREAARKGRLAWLATEQAFQRMATDLSLDAERAMVLVRRLLKEALDASPTADEIVRRWNEDDTTLAGQLFTRSLLEIVPDASPEDRRTLMLHMDQILNRLDAATARERVEIEQERAALAQRRQARAEEEQATRRETVAKLEARLIQLENDVEVERRVRQELETRATVAQPTSAALGSVAPVAVPAPGEAAGIKPAPFPLFSAKEAAYLARSAEPAIGGRSLRGKAVEDIEAAFWLWRGLAGDRPLDTYTREEADDLRRDMLRMLSSYGKGGPKHEMRANYAPPNEVFNSLLAKLASGGETQSRDGVRCRT